MLHMSSARRVATPSDIYLNQGVIIPFDSTYDSADYIYINNLVYRPLAHDVTSPVTMHLEDKLAIYA
jgi:hypothetical protein